MSRDDVITGPNGEQTNPVLYPGFSSADYPAATPPANSNADFPSKSAADVTPNGGGGGAPVRTGNGSQNLNDVYLASDGHLYRATRDPQTGSITGYEDGGIAINSDGSYADLTTLAGTWNIPVALLHSEVLKQHAAAENVAAHHIYQNAEFAGTDATGNDTYTVQMPDGTRQTLHSWDLLQNGGFSQADLDRIKQDFTYRKSREDQQGKWQDIQYVGADPNGNDTYSVMMPDGTHKIVYAWDITKNGASTQADLDRIKANQIYSNDRIAQGKKLQNIRSNGDGTYTVTNPDGSRTVMRADAIIASGSANADDLQFLDRQKTQQDLDYARQTSLAGKYSNITYGGAGNYSAVDYFGNHDTFTGANMNGTATNPAGSLSSPTTASLTGSLTSPVTPGAPPAPITPSVPPAGTTAPTGGGATDVGGTPLSPPATTTPTKGVGGAPTTTTPTRGGAGGTLTGTTTGGTPTTPGTTPPPSTGTTSTLTSTGSATEAELTAARNQWAQQASAADRLNRMGQSRYGQGMGFAGSTPTRFIGQ